MSRAARLLPLLLLAVAAVPSTRPIETVIGDLASADPAVRTGAVTELVLLRDAAIPALRKAAHDPRPAVAEAATGLLLNARWYTPADAPSIRLLLMNYGRLPPEERAGVIQTLIDSKNNLLPDYRNVAVRVLSADPADEVAWGAVAAFFNDASSPASKNPDAAWEAALEKLDPADRPPALTMLLGRCREVRGDTEAALNDYRHVLEQERDRPTTSGKSLDWAVDQVVRAETAKGHYAAAAGFLRDQFARSDDQSTSQPELIGDLLDLHAQHGPLPGLAADLRAAAPDPEDHTGLALSVLATRAGFPSAGDTLLAAAVADRPNETDVERVVRLEDAGDVLMSLGQGDAAIGVFQRVVTVDADTARGYIPLAYDRLSQLHAAAGDLQLAGDELQRAIDRQNGTMLERRHVRNGPRELWPLQDEQAQCYWYWLRAAQSRHDDAAAAEQARRIVASGSTDSGLFLEILPSITAAAKAEEVDAYFERVFGVEKARLDATPDDPTQLNDLAWLCSRSNRKLPEALAWATRAVKLAPLQSAFLDTLAECSFRTGDARTAVTLEERALAAHPDDEPFMRGQLDRFRAGAATQPATRP